MSLLPFWKLLREVRRIQDQFSIIAMDFYEPLLRQLHKRWLSKVARPLTGAISLNEKIAIFVLYQPNGVADSVLMTCDHLIHQGYSPFIICNSNLSEPDMTALICRSALLLVRPNFGYDFGAYQDGLHIIDIMEFKPDRLILMNDSTWFPLRSNDSSITRMEASGRAFTGQVEKIEPDQRKERGIDHFESHFLMFTRTALESTAFIEFWHNYRASSDRRKTITRGEKQLSDTMFKAGFKSEGLVSRNQFLNCLSAVSLDDFRAAITEFCDVHDRTTLEFSYIMQDPKQTVEWQQETIDKLDCFVERFNFVVTTMFVFASMKYLDLGFVKKGRHKIPLATQQKVLALAAAGKIEPLHPTVCAEMEQSVIKWIAQS
jgi:hypothetical protein